MRIAFIFHDASIYGAPKSLLDLIDGLEKLNADITCFAILPHEGPLLQEIKRRKIPYQVVSYRRWVHKIQEPWRISARKVIHSLRDNRLFRAGMSLRAAFQIQKHLKHWNVDIVYTNTSVIVVGALASYLAKKKHVWHIREFQEIDQGLTLDWGKKVFATVVAKTNAIIFISKTLHQYYQPWVKGVRTQVIYNGVATKDDFDRIKKNKQEYQRKDQPFTFCIVGRISPAKGQLEAVQALNILVKEGWKPRLLIAGKGNQKAISTLVRRLQLEEYVHLIGHVDSPYQSVYFLSDVCLMCSSHEAFGRVTVEAMASGLPVIGKKNKYTGTVELIQENQTGLLYEGNEVELAAEMRRLLMDPAMGQQLGSNAWMYAKDHLNREQYVQQVYDLLVSL